MSVSWPSSIVSWTTPRSSLSTTTHVAERKLRNAGRRAASSAAAAARRKGKAPERPAKAGPGSSPVQPCIVPACTHAPRSPCPAAELQQINALSDCRRHCKVGQPIIHRFSPILGKQICTCCISFPTRIHASCPVFPQPGTAHRANGFECAG